MSKGWCAENGIGEETVNTKESSESSLELLKSSWISASKDLKEAWAFNFSKRESAKTLATEEEAEETTATRMEAAAVSEVAA